MVPQQGASLEALMKLSLVTNKITYRNSKTEKMAFMLGLTLIKTITASNQHLKADYHLHLYLYYNMKRI